ncbi:hypothetical protein CHS0354_001466 [Potamilus streckersoni]|uniref:Uncharacterized protein n=1 Tax=Potamilus streckersoni TaxID=2493646 RepID=A0AAE0T819_9BIVA|nr:hypothetical protein CHS0354_001466 [Potamilus streckersoni]
MALSTTTTAARTTTKYILISRLLTCMRKRNKLTPSTEIPVRYPASLHEASATTILGDMTCLYSCAFRWKTPEKTDLSSNVSETSNRCTSEVDLNYAEELHDPPSEIPFASESMIVPEVVSILPLAWPGGQFG